MIKNDDVKEVIERRDKRRRVPEPPQDPELMHEDPGTPVHLDEDGFEYDPDIAPTSPEEDNDADDLNQGSANPATLRLEAEDASPTRAKRRRLELIELQAHHG